MSADAQADYDYQIIDYPGSDFTQVWDINSRGDVLGNSSIGVECVPFIYNPKNNSYKDVTPVAGYDCTSLLGISNSGIMVGSVYSDDDFLREGLILDKKGNAIVFAHPDAVSGTSPRAINNDGLVTGIAFVDQVDELGRGFIYDPVTETFTDIVPSVLTIAQGINEDGYVVGSALFDPTGSFGPPDPCEDLEGNYYGWLRAPDGTVTYFEVNGKSTRARDIADSGAITGWAIDPITGIAKSFVTELDGTQCQSITIPDSELLAIPGPTFTAAQGIKNSGEVVGNELNSYRGFIAIPK